MVSWEPSRYIWPGLWIVGWENSRSGKTFWKKWHLSKNRKNEELARLITGQVPDNEKGIWNLTLKHRDLKEVISGRLRYENYWGWEGSKERESWKGRCSNSKSNGKPLESFKRRLKNPKSQIIVYVCVYLIEDMNYVHLIISPVTRTMVGIY